MQKPLVDVEGRTSSLLAELIQAAGIVPEGGSESLGMASISELFAEMCISEQLQE